MHAVEHEPAAFIHRLRLTFNLTDIKLKLYMWPKQQTITRSATFQIANVLFAFQMLVQDSVRKIVRTHLEDDSTLFMVYCRATQGSGHRTKNASAV
jgi:hypothetical protein